MLIQPGKPETRTYSDFESVNECMEGLCLSLFVLISGKPVLCFAFLVAEYFRSVMCFTSHKNCNLCIRNYKRFHTSCLPFVGEGGGGNAELIVIFQCFLLFMYFQRCFQSRICFPENSMFIVLSSLKNKVGKKNPAS